MLVQPAGQRWLDLDPQGTDIRPIHPVGTGHWNPGFVAHAGSFVPFDQAASDAARPIQVVEYNGGVFVFSGHHRIYALRNLHIPPCPPAPATVRVQLFSTHEFANSPEVEPVFRGNLPMILTLIQGALAVDAKFPIV